MARYSAFLGRAVEVQYRAGEILLPASGTLVADSGRSIFLEQHFEQRGQPRQFRWEIPYQYIVRIQEALSGVPSSLTASSPSALSLAASSSNDARPNSATAVAGATGMASFLSLSDRPKAI